MKNNHRDSHLKIAYNMLSWGAIGTVGAISLDLANNVIENPANIVVLAGFMAVWAVAWLIARERQKSTLPDGKRPEFLEALKGGTLALLLIMIGISLVILSKQKMGTFGWLLFGKALAWVGGAWIFLSVSVGWWIAVKVESGSGELAVDEHQQEMTPDDKTIHSDVLPTKKKIDKE